MLGGGREKDLTLQTPTCVEGPAPWAPPDCLSDHHAVQSLSISWPAQELQVGRDHVACLLPHTWGVKGSSKQADSSTAESDRLRDRE